MTQGEGSRVAMIEHRLRSALDPSLLEIADESERHRGHTGAASGGGHFRVTVVASGFAGKSRLERHRLLYAALGDAMSSDIHALAIHAFTPEEWEARG
jgi:BolA protein